MEGLPSFANRETMVLYLRRYLPDYFTMPAMRQYLYDQQVFNVSRMDDHEVIDAIATHLMQHPFALRGGDHAGLGQTIAPPKANAIAAAQFTASSSSPPTAPTKVIDSSHPSSPPPARLPEPARQSTAAPIAPAGKADQTSPAAISSISSVTLLATSSGPNEYLPTSVSTVAPGEAVIAQPPETSDKEKELTVRWLNLVAYCGDKMELLGEGKNLGEGIPATVEIIHPEKGTIATLNGSGGATFTFN